MVVSIRRSVGDIVSGFQTLTKLRYKGDGVADILTIRHKGGADGLVETPTANRGQGCRVEMFSTTTVVGQMW